ncbi:hypothetical protein GUJ93_ZPchr0008g11934 [Zizania palustris]|uniref:Uncharacterized protein n=1 Tax=Zizania palustris TaxID=103762 RepID=A0A8J5RGA4_ZIZPA|nr:hypothetical protein GUJ93_ZPchr0008g11934 [Zizania palustris]
MAAFRMGARAVEGGRFQANSGGMASSRLQAPSKNPSNREEVALRGKLRSNHLAAAVKLRRRAGPMPLWRVIVFVSVALNVATLALLLYHYAPPPPHHHHQHSRLTASNEGSLAVAARREDRTTMASSTGKPTVTPDSVINLDQNKGTC